jgi:hypothetical protein
MSESLRQTIDLVTTLPSSLVENPAEFVEFAGIMLGAAALAYRDTKIFGHTEEGRFTQIPNAAQAEASVVDEREDRRHRGLRPGRLGVVGWGLVLASLVTHPQGTTDHFEDGSTVAVVQSMTYSMRDTYDLGSATISREDAVVSGIDSANFPGKLTIIQPGTTPVTSVPLSTNWHNHSAIKAPQTDPTDPTISSAITLAASQLPSGKKPGSHSGEVVVISDGIVSVTDQGGDLSQAAQTLKQEGVKVKFIVPGTALGTYKYKVNAPTTSSSEEAANFDAFGAQNVAQPQTASAVTHDVKDAISSVGDIKVKKDSYLLLAIGGILALAGSIMDRKQRRERYI